MGDVWSAAPAISSRELKTRATSTSHSIAGAEVAKRHHSARTIAGAEVAKRHHSASWGRSGKAPPLGKNSTLELFKVSHARFGEGGVKDTSFQCIVITPSSCVQRVFTMCSICFSLNNVCIVVHVHVCFLAKAIAAQNDR